MAANDRSVSPWLARVPERLDLWWPPLLVLAGIIAMAPLYAPVGLRPSPETVFAVQARTGVLEVQPACGRSLIWDLPAGRVLARDCDADDMEQCGGVRDTVTVTMAGGSTARIEMRADHRWGVTFGRLDGPVCSDAGDSPIRVTADYVELPADALGYFYVAEPASPDAPPPGFSLPLAGRVIVGQFVEFGGGWSGVQSATLSEGRVFGRDVAVGTGERLTLLDEELDPGSIVDTHPRLAGADKGGDEASDRVASGFVLSGPGDMLVQLSQRRSIAVTPYDGVPRRLEVPRWKVWWSSPLLQLVASIVGVFGGLLGLWIASQGGRIAYRQLRHPAEVPEAANHAPQPSTATWPEPNAGGSS